MTSRESENDYTPRKGWKAKRRCPHSDLRGIYGDEINARNSRLECRDCGRLLDGPVSLADSRRGERS